ncbi:hypothetical protein SAMN02745157_1444 [Kaistia soli DSM 19436]|uniref:Uncharacterized protein n=1 Tax=Kaistia soli DSM 19436 TaxID=1122133 RepID=A0A1M4Y7M2_9HYPH|nr:hypothetical protein [Kaistia soli]SHF01573.1 hypothetical protein SAMN02745157_1444 [Kaistia soli DSM 19436]
MSAPVAITWDVSARLDDTAAGDMLMALVQLAAWRQDLAEALKRFFGSGANAFRVACLNIEIRPADGAIILHLVQLLHEELGALLAAGRADIRHSGHGAAPSLVGGP